MNKKTLNAKAFRVARPCAQATMNLTDPFRPTVLNTVACAYERGYRDAVRELRERVKAGESFADKNNIIADIARDFVKPLR